MARILIADDSRFMRSAVREAMELMGHEVAEAADGDAALALYRSSPADVVITDMFMPGKDGVEVIQILRQDNPDVKVIAITGGNVMQNAMVSQHVIAEVALNAAKAIGAERVFTKPFELKEVIKAVEELLAGSK